MEYISEFSNTSAVDVIAFIKEVVEKFPNLRAGIIDSLLSTFGDVKAKKLFRGALWILGEYCIEEKDIKDALRGIRNSLGELPILDTEQRLLEKGDGEEVNGSTAPVAPSASRRVLADGTYATESAFSDSQTAAKLEAVKGATKPPLRCMTLISTFADLASSYPRRRLLSCYYFVIDFDEIGYAVFRVAQYKRSCQLVSRRGDVDNVFHYSCGSITIRQGTYR